MIRVKNRIRNVSNLGYVISRMANAPSSVADVLNADPGYNARTS